MLMGRGFRAPPDGYSTSMHERADERRFPVCGTGVFTDVVYEDPKPSGPELRQAGDSYEVLLFSCGPAGRQGGRGGTMNRSETPDPDPGPSPGPLPTPQPEPGPVPQPEPPTPEPSPRPEPPPDSEPPIRL
jgi:hypothetical protein